MVLLEQAGLKKKNLEVPTVYSVYQAAIQNRNNGWSWDSEESRVDWERGTLHGCSLIQDREKFSRI